METFGSRNEAYGIALRGFAVLDEDAISRGGWAGPMEVHNEMDNGKADESRILLVSRG